MKHKARTHSAPSSKACHVVDSKNVLFFFPHSASSASATSQDRTARLATRREEPVAVQIEQENVAAR